MSELTGIPFSAPKTISGPTGCIVSDGSSSTTAMTSTYWNTTFWTTAFWKSTSAVTTTFSTSATSISTTTVTTTTTNQPARQSNITNHPRRYLQNTNR